ncbi:MAG: hypothetical protein LBC19_08685, partial [Tannerella sp.]|nr:hypothetical protein [Tannerella sp.]
MLHTTEIQCPHCGNNNVLKQGKTGNGTQKRQCNGCKKHFRLEYRYRAWQAGTKEKIIEMTLNNSGVRDIGRVLGISKDTVCSVLKKTVNVNPYFLACSELCDFTRLEAEIHQLEHGAVYPIKLCERLIKMYSAEGDTVFDLFLGIGTTMIAAQGLNRHCVRTELNPKFAGIAQTWLDDVQGLFGTNMHYKIVNDDCR